MGVAVCSTTAGTAETRIEMEPLQLRSDILVKCFAVNTVTSQLSPRSDVRLLFHCQFHTSALSSHSLEFSAADLDLESPTQGQRSLEDLRVEFTFSPTSVTARCKSTLSLNYCMHVCRFSGSLSLHRLASSHVSIRGHQFTVCVLLIFTYQTMV